MKATHLISIILISLTGITAPAVARADEYWEQRVSLFDSLRVERSDIVFLGNSITDGGEFSELFNNPRIKNRGIRSDVIPGVMKRLGQVTKGKPAKIFLLIGINDVSHGHSAETLGEKYESLVKEIRRQTPETEVYVQSVMPINNDFGRYKGLRGCENVIVEFNRLIRESASRNGAVFIDLWPALADSEGRLRREYTNDGLHLTGAGYRAWTDVLKKYVDE